MKEARDAVKWLIYLRIMKSVHRPQTRKQTLITKKNDRMLESKSASPEFGSGGCALKFGGGQGYTQPPSGVGWIPTSEIPCDGGRKKRGAGEEGLNPPFKNTHPKSRIRTCILRFHEEIRIHSNSGETFGLPKEKRKVS